MTDRFYLNSGLIFWLLLSSQSVLAVEIREIGQTPESPSSPKVTPSVSPQVPANSQGSPTASPLQNLTTQQRLERLERAVNSAVLVEMARRQQELQLEVERLRSENEELAHSLEGMQTRLRNMYRELDQSLQRLEARGVAPATTGSASVSTTPSSTIAGNAVAQRKAYQRALKMLREKRYDQAVQAFQNFLKVYPQSEFADNAQYWIGEGYYVDKKYKLAVESFSSLIKNYPQSGKLADAYLKLGFTQYELKQYAEARKSLNIVLKDYAKSTGAVRLAKERLQLMDKEGH